MTRQEIANLSDQQIVNAIIHNDNKVIEYFFCVKCYKLFSYIVYSIYRGNVLLNELVNELYLYLASDNWKKMHQFDFRSKLMTWISVVAIRFFQKKRDTLIDSENMETLIEKSAYKDSQLYNMNSDSKLDIEDAISRIPNPRYRKVIRRLDLEEASPDHLAKEMNVTVANLYNIHRRAIIQLKLIMKRKEDYI